MNGVETAAAAAKPRPYPWVYTPSLKAKLGLCGCSLFLGGFGLFGIVWPILWPEPFWGWGIQAFIVAVCAGIALLGVYTALSAFACACATILTATSVERKDVFSRRAMRKSDILGFRFSAQENSFRSLTLSPRTKGRSLRVFLFRPDEDFEDWFADIPNLDAKDLEQAQQRLLKDPNLGATPKAREARLALYRKVGGVGYLVGFGVFFWAMAFPRPYEIAIAVAAATPVIAIALVVTSKGAMTFGGAGTDPRGTVSMLVLCGIVVPLRALLDIHPLDWRELARPAAVLVPLAMGLTWALRDRVKDTRGSQIVFGVMAIVIGLGDVSEANVLLDRSKAEVFAAQVLGKRIENGKHTSYDLTLSPWGPRTKSQEIDVGRALYDRVRVGEDACVYLRRGALGVRWFEVGACDYVGPVRRR